MYKTGYHGHAGIKLVIMDILVYNILYKTGYHGHTGIKR